ncbi:response regulator transcription factor [Paenibacillus harenae]|uniref:Two-component system response regulator YesN n=1 Tax=Paenibacillus harenae TaxID=306543 RepID=A0ABT9U517_PAEHA|nr:response regulator [Paenibacillus harenae]MDQ0114741.1 two-component system response regulator YesN [Paenibacillus harenae]
MYRVLIVDDEEPLREAIRILGDWRGLGVSEVLEASDGRMALELLPENKIDLVMVDMKMPEMTGMEFLQVVERDYPDLLTIVISGYNDFEYTRQAIHSKVVDYLLKPINRQDLNQALRKAIDLLDAKRKRESEFINRNITLNMSLPKLKEKVYLSIIERSFKSQSNEAFLPLIGADEPGNRFAAVVLRVLNLERIRSGRFHNDTDLLHFAVSNVLNEIAGDRFQSFSFANPKQERELIAVLTMKGGYREDIAYHSLHQMKRAASALQELFGITVVIGVGAACGDALDIASSYDGARAAMYGVDLLRLKGTTVMATGATGKEGGGQEREKERERDGSSVSITGRMTIIRGALETGNIQHARSILGELTKRWRSAERFTIGESDRVMAEYIILLNDMALELGVKEEQLPIGEDHPLRSMGLSADYDSFETYEALLYGVLDYYSELIRKAQSANRPFEVADIKAYIDDHYFEDIKISMFAEKYFLSREYLMKLFKGQFSYGIHEYVQKVRMDKAKELLGDPALKIQDISEMLGYKDKNYFSKAFRNYYNVSPSEYRTAHQDE